MPCSICRRKGHNARSCKSSKHVNERIEYLKNALKKAEKDKHYARASVTHFRVEMMAMKEDLNRERKKTNDVEKKLEKKDETIKGLRNNEKGMCNICFEELPLGEEYATKCGHCFHTKCLLTWLEKNNTCPCCRKELYEKYVIPEEYMSDDEFVDSDDEMPDLIDEGIQALAGSVEEKAPEEEDDSLHTQFELDVYQSMADTFGNIVTHPDQRDWMVDRHTLVEHLVQYTNHLIPDDPEYPVRVENVEQLLAAWAQTDEIVGADPLDDMDIADAVDMATSQADVVVVHI